MYTVKKISRKIFTIMMCCTCIAVLLLGAVSVRRSASMVQQLDEEMLAWMAKYYAADFSQELQLIQSQVDDLGWFLEETIELDKLKTDRNYLAEYEKQLAPHVEKFARERTSGIAGWVYFDPKWSDSPHDVYYVDGNDDGIPDRQNYIPFSYFDNTPTPTDDKYWWYGPIEKKSGSWSNPYEWKLRDNLSVQVVSYSLPVYIDGEFIGVVGTYYRFNDMSNDIAGIRAFQTGYACLLNEKLDIIVSPNCKSGTRYNSVNLATANGGGFSQMADELMKNKNGLGYYKKDGENTIIAYSRLSNDWILTINPRMDEMYAGMYDLIFRLLLAIAATLLISGIAAFLLGRRITRPILTLADAAVKIGTGDFSVRVNVNTNDEINVLADSMNSMTENIQLLQHNMERQAYYDELTGARTIVKFKLDAQEIINCHEDSRFTLIKMDIDQFKLFNGLHGFSEGDRLLVTIVSVLMERMNQQCEIMARMNADEFVILFTAENAEAIKNNFQGFIQDVAARMGNLNYDLIYAMGHYEIPKGETDVQDMFEKVNLAHRLAKKKPAPKVCEYDNAVRAIAIREKEIEAQQTMALENGEFMLYLQPKYLLVNETITGAEGLVRWNSAMLGMIYPDSFIPLFEKNGFIIKMDFFMFEKACKAIRGWIDAGLEPIAVSINFSRLHLGNVSFVHELCVLADKYDVPHCLLEIELTETAFFDYGDILVRVLHELHDAGFTLSMDDFGRGYSSLGLLKNLPFDELKLDRSFFIDAMDEERERVVIESIIGMAKKLNIKTVAEGVEDEAHVEFLRLLSCDIVQGYHYARPMPEDEFIKRLNKIQ